MSEPDIIPEEDFRHPPRNEPAGDRVLNSSHQFSTPASGNRHHPYARQRTGSPHLNRLFNTPFDKPVADDDSSIVVLKTIQYNPVGAWPPTETPLPHNQSSTGQQPASSRPVVNANVPPFAATSIPSQLSPQNFGGRKHVEFTTISTPRYPRTSGHGQDSQTSQLTPVPVIPVQPFPRTNSVAVQTEETCLNEKEKKESESANPCTTKSAPLPEGHKPKGNIKKFMDEFCSLVSANFCTRLDKFESDEEKEKVLKKLVTIIKGIKKDRSSTREIIEVCSVIDPKNFPYEIDRLWNKDLEKVAHMEKEETLKLMVEELNDLEKKLVKLDTKSKNKTITEAEQIEYNDNGTELAKKYFKYQKFLGSECQIRGYMYATQTQKFDFSKSKISTLPAVQHALENILNAKREQFLKCMTDVDSISTPVFSKIEEVVNDLMKCHHFENTQEENYEIAERFYVELVKEQKYRRMNDLWRHFLETINCPNLEALEQFDPANKHPGLAVRLRSNDTIASQRVRELFNEYSTDENSDSDTELEQEESMNLEFALDESNDDCEEEADRQFIVADAVVPTEPGSGLLETIDAEMRKFMEPNY